jgi:hypothetical protein
MSATGMRNERVFCCGGLAVVWAFFGLVLKKTKRRRSNSKAHTTEGEPQKARPA